jgi:hypothetical protein
MPRANKHSSLSQKVNERWRSSNERVRDAFVVARHIQHPLRFATARKIAKATTADPSVAIDPAQGFRIFPAGTFPEADTLAAAANRLLENGTPDDPGFKRKGKGRKRFLINMLDSATLDGEHPAVRLALRPDILASVVSYMGTVPVLSSVQVFYSGVLEDEPISSQLYHCDADDTRQVKIFVLCSDVGHANGPLTLLDADRSAVVRKATGYTFKSRLSDQDVDAALGRSAEAVELVGPPGTMCLVDTSRCFHFGSRVEPGAAPRLVTMIQYLSPHAFTLPGDYRSGAAVSWQGDEGMSNLQRAVLTGDHEYLARNGAGGR